MTVSDANEPLANSCSLSIDQSESLIIEAGAAAMAMADGFRWIIPAECTEIDRVAQARYFQAARRQFEAAKAMDAQRALICASQ